MRRFRRKSTPQRTRARRRRRRRRELAQLARGRRASSCNDRTPAGHCRRRERGQAGRTSRRRGHPSSPHPCSPRVAANTGGRAQPTPRQSKPEPSAHPIRSPSTHRRPVAHPPRQSGLLALDPPVTVAAGRVTRRRAVAGRRDEGRGRERRPVSRLSRCVRGVATVAAREQTRGPRSRTGRHVTDRGRVASSCHDVTHPRPLEDRREPVVEVGHEAPMLRS
jgi:hypothetical protein